MVPPVRWSSMESWWRCLLLLCLVPLSSATVRRGYILTVPKVLTAGETEQLSLTTFDLPVSQPVEVRLLSAGGTPLSETKALVVNGLTSWLELLVPQGTPAEAQVQVLANFPDLPINQTRPVRVRPSSLVVLIQTDKPVYLPGQTVRFRIAPLTPSLKPVSRYTEAQIWVENPARVRVTQWNAVRFHEAIVQLDLPLVAEPALGTWTIVCKISGHDHKKTFQVAEYVLPKFDVAIHSPPYIPADPAQASSWEVCSRYTYGESVEGKVSLELLPRWSKWEATSPFIYQSEVPADACVQFNVSSEQLFQEGLHLRGQEAKSVTATAMVVEKGTGIKRRTSKVVPVVYPHIKLEFSPSSGKYVKPGIPQVEMLKVTTMNGEPVESEPLKICLQYSNLPGTCKNFFSDIKGSVNITFSGREGSSYVKLTVTASRRKEKVEVRKKLQTWFSPSGHYLQILPHTSPLGCHRLVHITVSFTWPWNSEAPVDVQFHHQVTARGKLVQKGSHWRSITTSLNKTQPLPENLLHPSSHQQAAVLGEFRFSFMLRGDYSAVTLLVYFVLPGGEIVADTRSFPVEPCFSHPVEMAFENSRHSPGTLASMKIQAAPNSICGIAAIDRSVELLGDDGAIMTTDRLFSLIEPPDSVTEPPPIPPCLKDPQPTLDRPIFPKNPFLARTRRSFLPMRRARRSFLPMRRAVVDFQTAFEEAGLMVLSNLLPTEQSCYVDPYPNGLQFVAKSSGPHSGLRESGSPSQVRDVFPETWLWTLVSTDENGTKGLEAILPHTITSWKAQALCIHRGKLGLGLSPPTSLTVVQPFFLRMDLPYSVVRGEILPLKVVLFNYLDYCLAVRLSMEHSAGFVLDQGDMSRKVCACRGRSTVETFAVRPTSLGHVNITVHALSLPSDLSCGGPLPPATPDPITDAVRRTLLVKSEGYSSEEVTNSVLCPTDYPGGFIERRVRLTLPREVVPGSASAFFYVSGDLIAPSLQGLEKLVQMPTGCGEQNMAMLAPNIGVLDYLRAAGQLSVELQSRLLDNLRHGYQRQLGYLRSDGSFSAFGEKDPEGSTWLTAFVVKGLHQASKHIFVDMEILAKSKSWILSSQLENGCFPARGLQASFHGGLEREAENLAPLTAFVVLSLLESGLSAGHPAVTHSWECLSRHQPASLHALALLSYAAVLSRHPSAEPMLRKLQAAARQTRDEISWLLVDDPSRALAIETASYALMAFLGHEGPHFRAHCPAIVRWLANQRNSLGGFVSTQDTVAALQALTQYAAWVAKNGSDELDLTILVSGDGDLDEVFTLTPFNRLVHYTTSIPQLPTTLELRSHGLGCAFLQTSVKYHVTKSHETPIFGLNVRSGREPPNCKALILSVCTLYKPFGSSSNMALVDVEFLSGFAINSVELHKLTNRPGSLVKRTEVKDGHVVLYYDKVENEIYCLNLSFTQDIEVQDQKPAAVTVYDYYEPARSAVQNYAASDLEDCEARKSLMEPVEAWTGMPIDDTIEIIEPVQTVVDHDLDFPDGPESNQPVVVSPPPHFSTPGPPEDRCPRCWETFPSNFPTIYCAARQVVRMVVMDPGVQRARVETDVSPSQSRPRSVSISLQYQLPSGCTSCLALLQRGQYLYVTWELPQEWTDDSILALEGPTIHIIPTSTRIVEPKPVLQARQTCPPPIPAF